MFTLRKNNMTSLLGDWIYPAMAFISAVLIRTRMGFIFDFLVLLLIFLFLTGNKSPFAFGNKEDILLNSLPLKRKDIVKDKYICFLIYIFSINAAFFAGSLLFSSASDKYFEISFCLLMLFMSILYVAINLPLEYFDDKISNKINSFLYMGFIFIPIILEKFIHVNKMLYFIKSIISFFGANVFFMGISLILYYVSYKISCKIYEKKDF